MAPQEWMLPLVIMGAVITLISASRQTNHESLKSALDAVARKQRSLDENSPEYYNNLHSFKYHGKNDAEQKFDRDLDDEEEEIEFLPSSSDNGQLETVGDGFQSLNNKLLERALLDYLENLPEEEEPVVSIFRERERSSSHKRGGLGDRLNNNNNNNNDFAKLLGDEMQNGPLEELDDNDYLSILQMLYDRYRSGRGNKIYETTRPMSWGELLSKGTLPRDQEKDINDNEFVDRDQDQNILYMSPADRRNVNGRYPIGREYENYRKLTKRYPIAKRSPKPDQTKLKTIDPKVAQDLDTLFGTQSRNGHNNTYNSDHTHDDMHDQKHEHTHGQNHDHNHDHTERHIEKNSSEIPPKVTTSREDQNKNATKSDKSKLLQIRKKSVDWSQYFGIDRRKKKATFMAGQGTQDQDDEWMLQRYYENMAENLKPNEHENEQKDKLEQMDSKLKHIKDLIVEEALRYANSEDERDGDFQKVREKLMERMAAAYSLQKMRKALNDLRNNAMAQKAAQKTQKETQSNLTSNYRNNGNDNSNANVNNNNDRNGSYKRSSNNNKLNDDESAETAKNCPELEAIEWRCRTVDNLAGDTTQMLYVPCVMLQICKACTKDEEGLLPCLSTYTMEVSKICDALDSREEQISRTSQEEKQSCANAALLLSQLQPPANLRCRVNSNESCLQRYHYRYSHRYPHSPSNGHRLHSGFDAVDLQQSSDR